MNVNAPSKITFIISLVLVILALLGGLGVVGVVAGYSFWLAVVAWVVLAAGCVMKGM